MSPVKRAARDAERIVHLLVAIDGIYPKVLREIVFSSFASLAELHDLIQASLLHSAEVDYHFDADGVRYLPAIESDAPEAGDCEATAFEQLNFKAGDRFHHVVDNGAESWHHHLTVQKTYLRESGHRVPFCASASRAAPPEDCGGPAGYAWVLAALRDPQDVWAQQHAGGVPDDFDPGFADLTAINAAVSRVPKKRLRLN